MHGSGATSQNMYDVLVVAANKIVDRENLFGAHSNVQAFLEESGDEETADLNEKEILTEARRLVAANQEALTILEEALALRRYEAPKLNTLDDDSTAFAAGLGDLTRLWCLRAYTTLLSKNDHMEAALSTLTLYQGWRRILSDPSCALEYVLVGKYSIWCATILLNAVWRDGWTAEQADMLRARLDEADLVGLRKAFREDGRILKNTLIELARKPGRTSVGALVEVEAVRLFTREHDKILAAIESGKLKNLSDSVPLPGSKTQATEDVVSEHMVYNMAFNEAVAAELMPPIVLLPNLIIAAVELRVRSLKDGTLSHAFNQPVGPWGESIAFDPTSGALGPGTPSAPHRNGTWGRIERRPLRWGIPTRFIGGR